MGGRWKWMGMVALCTLASACQGDNNADAASPAMMQARDSANGGPTVPVMPALAQGDNLRPQGGAPPDANAQVPPNTAPPPGATRPPAPRAAEPTRGTTAQAPANAPTRQDLTAPGNAPRAPDARQPGTQAPSEGRVMIGAQAVQARDDEAWYEGAAKAAQAAVTDTSANRPLEQVIIASSAVSGRVTHVGRDSLHVRDGEGTVYELQLDPRSRGLHQGQRVSLQELQEGTPVRAQFVLMGGRTVARDVQVRR
ncbi:hypothetical protein [Corallococcus sp. Z5C101001]|uniref:hypothetical protein n=1 Tax=Corallococcus sp. Z5C101001 TaxID=2596829 RepID=UPI002104A31B|nr:hypothetical protein [Corallococcus sp. Z5C101001]